jgi:hypothetical protein
MSPALSNQDTVQIQNVLRTVVHRYPDVQNLVIQADNSPGNIPVSLVDHTNNVLSAVRGQADILLERYDQLSGGPTRRLRRFFKRCLFALDKETIQSLAQAVEQAHHHLHMALTLASVNADAKW